MTAQNENVDVHTDGWSDRYAEAIARELSAPKSASQFELLRRRLRQKHFAPWDVSTSIIAMRARGGNTFPDIDELMACMDFVSDAYGFTRNGVDAEQFAFRGMIYDEEFPPDFTDRQRGWVRDLCMGMADGIWQHALAISWTVLMENSAPKALAAEKMERIGRQLIASANAMRGRDETAVS